MHPFYLILSSLAVCKAEYLYGVPQQPLNRQHPSIPPLTYIPPIGLGTWLSKPEKVSDAVTAALNLGYRHIDAAAVYGNEPEVGAGIAASHLPRQNLWITSKLWNDAHRPEDVKPALLKTLSDLGVPYLDLYLMHWPIAFNSNVTIEETYAAMEELVKEGLTKNIGVSNFSPKDLGDLLAVCRICPVAHEFETHPYLQQQEFVDWHLEHGIQVIAYSPFANLNPTYDSDLPSILEDEFWVQLAGSKNVSVPQAILAWGMQRATVVIPKSVHAAYILDDYGSKEVRFSAEEMASIAAEDKKVRFNDPSENWGKKFFEGLDG